LAAVARSPTLTRPAVPRRRPALRRPYAGEGCESREIHAITTDVNLR
jgi:hypothetical protein